MSQVDTGKIQVFICCKLTTAERLVQSGRAGQRIAKYSHPELHTSFEFFVARW